MTVFERSIKALNERFRLGEHAAMPRDRDEALAKAVEERLKAIESRVSKIEGENK